MTWYNSYYLWLLLLIPLLFGGVWWWNRYIRKKRKQYFDESLFEQLRRNYWPLGNKIKLICFYAGLAFLIVGLAGPKIGTEVRELKRQGVDLMIGLDLSSSMKAEDVSPSRLSKAKHEINRLLQNLKGDRVGLIVFTGDAFLQSPMTLDYSALRMYLNVAEPEMMPSTTTDFASVMKKANEAFKTEKIQKSNAAKVLLLISDGENHGDSYDNQLDNLVENNVSIYTVGIGNEAGTRIPIYNEKTGRLQGYKRNKSGEVVTTRLESRVLESIARKGNGDYYEINSGGDGIDPFLGRINELQKGEFASQEYADYKNQYQWLTGIGLGLVLLWILVPKSKS